MPTAGLFISCYYYMMDVKLEPGKYVVAVSGGVDSVVLLDVLSKLKGKYELVVAHYDHGIRPGSKQDRLFVGDLAKKYGLDFYFEEGSLGPKASEALAREKRYKFLMKVKDKAGSDGIVTAHHRDDLLETAVINVARGTKRKGLTSLKSTAEVKRPLLDLSKRDLMAYARKHGLDWREDETNSDEKYLRNHIRQSVLPKLDKSQKNELLGAIRTTEALSKQIDDLLIVLGQRIFEDGRIKRNGFAALPHEISKELLADWLRKKQIAFDSAGLERLVIFAKTAKAGAKTDIEKDCSLKINKDSISLVRHQSV